jgi:hypothetical protein
MMRDQRTPKARSTFARTFVLSAALSAGLLALAAFPSYGRATVGSFESVTPFSETITNFPCFEGVPATMTGTVTSEGHFTETTSGHFSVHGTDTIDYRVDLGDGRYALGQVADHFGFRVNTNRPRTTETGTQQERATLYAADGQELGEITVHVTIHVTYADENGNFEPDPGEITTSFERFNVSCP